MSRTKRHLGTFNQGTVVESEVTLSTQWVQLRGTTIVRCDDDAKETGSGLWVIQKFGGGRRSWVGKPGYLSDPNGPGGIDTADPTLWLRDDWRRVYVEEKDYS
jgi:hypothetical protein